MSEIIMNTFTEMPKTIRRQNKIFKVIGPDKEDGKDLEYPGWAHTVQELMATPLGEVMCKEYGRTLNSMRDYDTDELEMFALENMERIATEKGYKIIEVKK